MTACVALQLPVLSRALWKGLDPLTSGQNPLAQPPPVRDVSPGPVNRGLQVRLTRREPL